MVDLSTLNIEFIHLNDNYYNGIRARMSINTKYNFAKILGKESIDVAKQAEVRILPVVRLAGVSPLGVKKDKLDEFLSSGQFTGITLKYGGGGGTGGDFGAIDLDGVKGGGADDFERWLTYGYTMELGINEGLLPIEPGNMAGPTTRAINRRYKSCTHFPSDGGCNYQHYEPTCQRVLKVPIVVEANKKMLL